MSKLNISDSTNISMPVRNMLAIIGAVAMGVWAYFGITEQLNKHSTTLELMQKDLSENTEFRIKYPRGELGQSQNDLEQFMLIEHLAGELEKLSTDIEQGKAPFDQQQALTLNFFETRINKLEKQIDDLKDKIVNNHYEAVKKNGH